MTNKIIVEPMRPEDITAASIVCAKAYLTNPLNVAVVGGDQRRNEVMMRSNLEHFPDKVYVAKEEGQVIGLMKTVEWPNCQMPPLKMLRSLPFMIREFGGNTLRLWKWLPVWAKHDPKQPHWHLGPFAVLPERQGQGVGSQLLRHFCEHVDQLEAAAYLETDRPENVPLYERFGFMVIAEATVLGVPNWFMWRSPVLR